jgi:hypothetical protein
LIYKELVLARSTLVAICPRYRNKFSPGKLWTSPVHEEREMDPVTTAIIAGLSADASNGIPEVAKKAIADGNDGLKALLKRKFGTDSDVVGAVEMLESKPDSAGRQRVLAKELFEAARPRLTRRPINVEHGARNEPESGEFVCSTSLLEPS